NTRSCTGSSDARTDEVPEAQRLRVGRVRRGPRHAPQGPGDPLRRLESGPRPQGAHLVRRLLEGDPPVPHGPGKGMGRHRVLVRSVPARLRDGGPRPGGKDSWYSVTLMSGPGEDPTPAQIDAVRQLRQWLMGKGVAGAVRGHRDFIPTSCPGDRLYRLVKNGTFSKAPSEEDDDMQLNDKVKIK